MIATIRIKRETTIFVKPAKSLSGIFYKLPVFDKRLIWKWFF